MINEYAIFTDGSCKPNPGKGGWAVIIRNLSNTEEDTLYGSEPITTNNRMEMTAVIHGLRSITAPACVTIYSDSQLVIGCASKGWRRNKNKDLWTILDALIEQYDITWQWVRGHDGHIENERVDALAQAAARQGEI